MNIKIPGHCTICDRAVFEVVERHSSGILEGHPKKFGKPIDAIRVEYFLADGSRCTMTCCKDCLDAMVNPENFPKIWEKVIHSFIFENKPEVREQMRARIPTPEQKNAIDKFILSQIDNFLIQAVETHG